MDGSGDGERLWVVESDSDDLREILQERRETFRLFRILPLIGVPGDHPRLEHPPQGVVLAPPHDPDDLAIAIAIDVFLVDLGALTSTQGENGNAWLTDPHFWFWDRETKLLTMGIGASATVAFGQAGAIVLSLQRWPGAAPHPLSPLSIATGIASQVMPVIVAAGNWRTLGEGDTMNPLSRLPGVISVGATEDAAGSVLTTASSVAGVGGRGPDLVAWGRNVFDHSVIETSFAAPRAAGYAMFIAAWLRQVGAVIRTLRTGEPHGAPVLVSATIDSGFRGFDPTPSPLLSMLPYGLGVDVEACASTRAALLRHDRDLDIVASAHMVREILMRSARPGPGDAHEVGAGFIDLASTIDTIASLTLNDLMAIGRSGLEPLPELDALPLARVDELATLFDVAIGSRVQYGLQYLTRVIHAPARPR